MKLGMIGLGRMGGNMATRLRQHGHEVIGYDRDPNVSDVSDLADLVGKLGDGQRVAWVMVPSGKPTDATISELAGLLRKGDIVVDGGNSNWRDSQRHGDELAAKGIGFIDCGTSGGVWGLDEGYCLMVGGDKAAFDRVVAACEDDRDCTGRRLGDQRRIVASGCGDHGHLASNEIGRKRR